MSEDRAYGLEDGAADARIGHPPTVSPDDDSEYAVAYREAYEQERGSGRTRT